MDTQPIPPGVAANFQTLLRAAAAGDLGLISCNDAKTGEPRWVIAAFARQRGGGIAMTPFGHMSGGNPYDDYVAPATC